MEGSSLNWASRLNWEMGGERKQEIREEEKREGRGEKAKKPRASQAEAKREESEAHVAKMAGLYRD